MVTLTNRGVSPLIHSQILALTSSLHGHSANTPPPAPPALSHFTPSLTPPSLFQTCFLQLGGCGGGESLVSWVNVVQPAVCSVAADH